MIFDAKVQRYVAQKLLIASSVANVLGFVLMVAALIKITIS